MKYLVSQSIDALFLPVRCSNALKRRNVITLGDFIRIKDSSIRDIIGLGSSSREGLVQLKSILQSALTETGIIDVDQSILPLARPIPLEATTFQEPEPIKVLPSIKVAPQDDFPVSALNISVRAKNALRLQGISLVSQIVNLNKNDFLAFRNVGRSTAEELYQAVQQTRTQFISSTPIPTDLSVPAEPPLKPEPAEPKGYSSRISTADYVLWSQWQRFRYYDIKGRDFTDFLQELNLSQYKDIEITTLKIWREHPDLMQQYDIRDDYELHNLLRKILTSEQIRKLQLDFVKMPTLIFGKADRDMQVLEQLMLYAPISAEELGQRYEEAYGIKAATAMGTYFKSIDTYFHDGIYRIDSKDLTHEQYQHMRSLMTEDIYLIDNVKRMYQRAYPDASVSDITPYTLKVLGFNVYSGYIIRNTFPSAGKYFQSEYFSKDILDVTEMPFALYNSSMFNTSLHKHLLSRDLTAYAPKQYINIHRLEQSGVTKATLEDYCAKVYDFVCAKSLDIFTMTTLHTLGFSHELDDLGFDDYFYASVLSVDREHFDYCRIAGQWGFSPAGTYPAITRSTLIESIVRREGKIEIYDLVALCKEEYGILTNRDDVKLFINSTSLYYDAIMQTVYANYDLYLEEF